MQVVSSGPLHVDSSLPVRAIKNIIKDEARQLLYERDLSRTAPRLAVLLILANAQNPLSHTEVLQRQIETNSHPVTITRNLVKLKDAGVAPLAPE